MRWCERMRSWAGEGSETASVNTAPKLVRKSLWFSAYPACEQPSDGHRTLYSHDDETSCEGIGARTGVVCCGVVASKRMGGTRYRKKIVSNCAYSSS